MKGIHRYKILCIVLIAAYLLSACSGMAPQSTNGSPVGSGKPQSLEVAFTGPVETLGSDAIVVNGQTISIGAQTVLDPNIKVGDIVKVEAQVSETGEVVAVTVESFGKDDVLPTESSATATASASAEAPQVEMTGTPAPTTAPTTNTADKEIVGVLSAFSTTSVTVDGVEYPLASFTEFKGTLVAGDMVKVHVIVNADGTFTVREIEKAAGTGISGTPSSDDDSNDDNGNDGQDDDHDDDSSSSSGSGH